MNIFDLLEEFLKELGFNVHDANLGPAGALQYTRFRDSDNSEGLHITFPVVEHTSVVCQSSDYYRIIPTKGSNYCHVYVHSINFSLEKTLNFGWSPAGLIHPDQLLLQTTVGGQRSVEIYLDPLVPENFLSLLMEILESGRVPRNKVYYISDPGLTGLGR